MNIPQFMGYRRENGKVGIRNHVIILPLDDLSNAASEAVANNIKGTMALPHPYGRLQFGEDLELLFRTLIGTGTNPNVAAVVVIGIGKIIQGKDDYMVPDPHFTVFSRISHKFRYIHFYHLLVFRLWMCMCSPFLMSATTLPMSWPYLITVSPLL